MFELSIFLRDRLIGRQTFSLDEVRIGRSTDNEVRIDNPALSRYHASIESVAGIHLLKDFGSQNGTYVNGERVQGRAGLNDGDRISMGKFTLVFRPSRQRKVTAPEVTDHASYAAAGKTMVMKTPLFERPCPWIGYLEETASDEVPPPRHAIDRDLYLVGTEKRAQLKVDAKPARVAFIVRSWGGFSLIALEQGVQRNEKPVKLTAQLKDGDRLKFGSTSYAFHTGQPSG